LRPVDDANDRPSFATTSDETREEKRRETTRNDDDERSVEREGSLSLARARVRANADGRDRISRATTERNRL
jgi:hypothetical protein